MRTDARDARTETDGGNEPARRAHDRGVAAGQVADQRAAVGGDAAAFAEVGPIVVLAHTRFPRSAEAFVRGVNDSVYSPQQRKTDLAALAGMDVTATVLERAR